MMLRRFSLKAFFCDPIEPGVSVSRQPSCFQQVKSCCEPTEDCHVQIEIGGSIRKPSFNLTKPSAIYFGKPHVALIYLNVFDQVEDERPKYPKPSENTSWHAVVAW